MSNLLSRFRDDESGATAIEYALIGTLLSVAIVLGATAVGTKLHDVYVALGSKIPATN